MNKREQLKEDIRRMYFEQDKQVGLSQNSILASFETWSGGVKIGSVSIQSVKSETARKKWIEHNHVKKQDTKTPKHDYDYPGGSSTDAKMTKKSETLSKLIKSQSPQTQQVCLYHLGQSMKFIDIEREHKIPCNVAEQRMCRLYKYLTMELSSNLKFSYLRNVRK